MKKANTYIGTSGWHYKGWLGFLYPDKMPANEMLSYYAHQFKSVELNTSFYGMPKKESILNWCRTTPDDFIFSCKASRYITHINRLNDFQDSLNYLLNTLEHFENKLGPILFQLPPKWPLDFSRLEKFIHSLPKTYRYTFEFRDASWLCQPVYELLMQHHIALCFYDFKGIQSPEYVTADFVYLRMHGPRIDPYVGDYSEETLQSYGLKIEQWCREGKDVFCYFDNDQKAYAPKDAKRLMELIKSP